MASDPVRDEAERLIAAAIAAVSLAARGLGGAAGSRFGGARAEGHGFATGSPECCVCPVCRVISAMRDPSPDLAERLATGAGDLATAVTGLLRNFSRPGGPSDEPAERAGGEFWDSTRRQAQAADAEADPWHAATTAGAAVDGSTAPPVKPMARKAVKKAARAAAAVEPTDAPTTAAEPKKTAATEPKKMAKKTAKKAVKKATPPPGTTP
jgi:hypothetical protein